MKTTLELPDDPQKLGVPAPARKRLKLPLTECAHEARPGEEMTPGRVAEVLLEEEAGMHRGGPSSRENPAQGI
jgi:hypothetical protein